MLLIYVKQTYRHVFRVSPTVEKLSQSELKNNIRNLIVFNDHRTFSENVRKKIVKKKIFRAYNL